MISNQNIQINRESSNFQANKKKKQRKQQKSNLIDLRFLDSSSVSEQSEDCKLSLKKTQIKFPKLKRNKNKKIEKKDVVEKIHQAFIRDFPDHETMSPTTKFQNKFFSRKNV